MSPYLLIELGIFIVCRSFGNIRLAYVTSTPFFIPSTFYFINKSETVSLFPLLPFQVDDAEEFRSLTTALFTLGVTNTEQEGLWRLLSALLHLGNIRFIETEAPAGGTGDSQGPGLRLESPLVEVEEVARMAGLPADRLVSSMRKKVRFTVVKYCNI